MGENIQLMCVQTSKNWKIRFEENASWVQSSRAWKRKRNFAPGYTLCEEKKNPNRQTILVPESQICQRCAGTSCRFPEALVSHRSYSQSTQTHRNRRRRHSPGNAGSQLEIENRLSKETYLSLAETLIVFGKHSTWEVMWHVLVTQLGLFLTHE